MKISFKIALLALVAGLLSGCCACRSQQKRTQRPLVGTNWQLVQLNGKSIAPEQNRFSFSLNADGNRLTGYGACNRLMGSFAEGEKRALKIGPMASTRMACPDMGLEQEFIQAIEATTHYDMDGPMLILLSNGEAKAVLQAQQ